MNDHPHLENAKSAAAEKRWGDLEREARLALQEDPASVPGLHFLAQALGQTGQHAEAADTLEQLLKLAPKDRAARLSLASLSWHRGEFQRCADLCASVLEEEPDNGHLWNSCGLCLMALNRVEEALPHLAKAAELQPTILPFQLNFAQALEKANMPRIAVPAFLQAHRLDPNLPEPLRGLAKAYFLLGITEEARKAMDALASRRALTTDEQILNGEILLLEDRSLEALEVAERALETSPGLASAHQVKATALQQLGRHDEAVIELNSAIRIDPNTVGPYLKLTESRRMQADDQALIEQMLKLAEREDLGELDAARLQFALGKAFDDLKEYERAMACFDRGHAILKPFSSPYDPDRARRSQDALIATFSKEFFANRPIPGLRSAKPIFVVGLPRSGTTLAETVLSSHPLVAAAGELSFWSREAPQIYSEADRTINTKAAIHAASRYLDRLTALAPDAERVTDKLPANTQNVGLLHTVFPNARFVHCRRHPVDSCLSFHMNIRSGADFVHDKASIVFNYREYARLMIHWREVLPEDRFFDLDYEELVSDQERLTRRLIEFCGLEWDEACLAPERNDRVISTASHWQARQPVYKGSVERWRRYEPWLGPFRELLDSPPPR